MGDEQKLITVSTKSLSGNLRNNVGSNALIAGVGAALVASLWLGVYWVSGSLAIVEAFLFFRLIRRKTDLHEEKMSLPAAFEDVRRKLNSLALDPALNSI